MTKKEANIFLAAILETLAETNSPLGGIPSGHIYMALMGKLELNDFNLLLEIAKQGNLIAEKHHLLNITDKGRDMVSKIQAMRG